MKYTQRILQRSRAALESDSPVEDVVDQAAIDAQPVEDAAVDGDVVPGTDTPPGEAPAEEPAPGSEVVDEVPVVDAVADIPAEGEPVAAVAEIPEEGDVVLPPQVIPVTDDGEATVDQIDAVVEGDPLAAAEAVAEADSVDGDPVTAGEVLDEAEAVAAETPPAEGEIVPEDSTVTDLGENADSTVSDVEAELADNPPEDVPPVDGDAEGDVPEEPGAVEEPVDGAELPEDSVPAVEDCACEEAGANPPAEGVEGAGEAEVTPVISGDAGEAPSEDSIPVPVSPAESVEEATFEENEGGIDFGDYTPSDDETGEILEGALDTYPQVVAVLEGAMDNGGVSLEAMQLINIFAARDGLREGGPSVSLESYNFTARSQSKIALEDFKEDIKGWVVKLVQWLKDRATEAMKWIRERLDATERLKAGANAILGKLEGADVQTAAISFRGSEKLVVKGAISGDFDREFDKVSEYAYTFIQHVPQGTLDFVSGANASIRTEIIDKIMDRTKSELDPKETYAAVSNLSKRYMDNLSSGLFTKRDGPSDDVVYLYSRDMPGDTRFVFTFPNRNDGTESILKPIKFAVNRGEPSEPKEIKPLSIEQVRSVATGVIYMADSLKKGSTYLDEMEKDMGALAKETERLASLDKNTVEDKAHTAAIAAVRRLATVLGTLTTDVLTGSIGYFSGVAGAALNYANASITKAAAEPESTEAA